MKKKHIVGIIGVALIFLASTSNESLAINEDQGIKQIIQEELEPDSSRKDMEEVKKSKLLGRNFSANSTVLPSEEYQKVKQLQNEYQAIYNNSPVGKKFTQDPLISIVKGYDVGIFATEQIQYIDDVVNFYRSLAGVEKVDYSKESELVAQQAAIGMAAVQTQSHNIYDNFSKPVGMTDKFWEEAGYGAKYSNIHSSAKEMTLENHANGFMVDYGVGNKTAGHRRGILGLTADSFGVGYAKAETEGVFNFFTALYTKNTAPAYKKYGIDTISHWPSAEIFPYEMYNSENPYNTDYYKTNSDSTLKSKYEKNMRWSIFMHQNGQYLSSDTIKVNLIDNDTGVITEMKNDTNGGELTITDVTSNTQIINSGYDAIVFRPNNEFEIKKDTLYTVKVTGIERNDEIIDYEYSTRFVGMYDQYEIEKIPVADIKIDSPEKELFIGENYQLTTKISPESATNKTVTWSSSSDTISISDTGLVTALKPGAAIITVSTEDGNKTAQIVINTMELRPEITKITIERQAKNIIILNTTMPLKATAEPANVNLNDIVWKSANEKVATVSSGGIVTGRKNGIVTITAYSEKNDMIKDSYQVVVTNKNNKTFLSSVYGNPIKDTFDYGVATEHFSGGKELTYGSVSSMGSLGLYAIKVPETGTYRISTNIGLDDADTESYEPEFGIYNDFYKYLTFEKKPDGSLKAMNSIYYSVNIDYYTAAKGWKTNNKVLKYHPDDTIVELEKNETIYFQVYAKSNISMDSFWINNGKLSYEHGIDMGTPYEITLTKE